MTRLQGAVGGFSTDTAMVLVAVPATSVLANRVVDKQDCNAILRRNWGNIRVLRKQTICSSTINLALGFVFAIKDVVLDGCLMGMGSDLASGVYSNQHSPCINSTLVTQ